MAIKKSELYSSLWSSCDELRGGMDASQYKDYVLVMLFIKYISDKFAGVPYAPITIPKGASFNDMVALKGKPTIGDDINKKIISPIMDANKLSDMPDFNDVTKLGSGKEMVDRLTNLIAIFENKSLDFSKNRAEGDDILGRFKDYGIPPAKNGDYAYLLHIIRTLKSKGKGACILPHGVLFRGNAEAEIRKNIIRKGYIKGIIALPANLFYGTGIPACIIVLDKENAHNRKGIFMIDAGKGFMKDGNKNRLRSIDIHKIVDVFNKQTEIAKYSRMVPFVEIEKNEFNLNIPRYIDSQEADDIQDIEAHLIGDIPNADIEALENYWTVYPTLKSALFGKSKRPKYCHLKAGKEEIKQTIFQHPEFETFTKEMNALFAKWKKKSAAYLKELKAGIHPKAVIFELSENLLTHYTGKSLISKYDVYQHLMDYWADVMQDDCYIVAADGWKAETYRILIENKQKKMVDKGWTCDLVPKELVITRFFLKEKQAIEALEAEGETLAGQLTELEEEHSGEEGFFAELDKVTKANVQNRLKEIKGDADAKEEIKVLKTYLALLEQQAETNRKIKEANAELDKKLYAKYPTLTEDEIQTLVVDDKWMATIDRDIHTEMDRISQRLTQRIKELAERYETPLPKQTAEVSELEKRVNGHLEKMGYTV